MIIFKQKAFTIPELLVVVSILSIVGVFSLTIFTRTLKGNNKSQIVSVIKENGQQALDQMTAMIRNADDVACISNDNKTIVVVKDGKYTRFRFIEDLSTPPLLTDRLPNYSIGQDNPEWPFDTQSQDEFLRNVCTDPLGTDSANGQVALTDTDPKTGVRVQNGVFTKPEISGFKDSVAIKFDLLAGSNAPVAVTGQIDPISFQTTVELR